MNFFKKNKFWIIAIVTIVAIVALDLVTKELAENYLQKDLRHNYGNGCKKGY